MMPFLSCIMGKTVDKRNSKESKKKSIPSKGTNHRKTGRRTSKNTSKEHPSKSKENANRRVQPVQIPKATDPMRATQKQTLQLNSKETPSTINKRATSNQQTIPNVHMIDNLHRKDVNLTSKEGNIDTYVEQTLRNSTLEIGFAILKMFAESVISVVFKRMSKETKILL